MASKGAIQAGRGEVVLGVDLGPLRQGLDAAKANVQSFGSAIVGIGAGITAAGAAITAPFLAALGVYADFGSEMLDMSYRTGTAVDALSELSYAVEQSGGNAEVMEAGFKGMAKLIAGAAEGSAEASDKLRELGLSLADLSGLTQDQRFELLVDKLSQIEDPAQRAAAAMGVFGKSGMKMLPLIQDGAAGIQALREEARRLGISMSTEDAAAAESLGDQFSAVAKQAKMMSFHVGAAIAPIAKEFLGAVMEVAAGVIDWIKNNRELLALVFKIGAALVVAGTVIGTVGAVIYGFGTALGIISSVIGTVIAVASALAVPILVLGTLAAVAWAAWEVLKAFPELGTAIGGAFSSFAGYMSEWTPILQEFGSMFMSIWEGVSNAISGGDLGLAFDIAWQGIQLVWIKGINWLKDGWYAFKFFFLTVWDDIAAAVSGVFTSVVTGISKAMVWVTARIVEGINVLISAIPKFVQDRAGISAITPIDESAMNADLDRQARASNRPGPSRRLESADRTAQRELEADLEWNRNVAEAIAGTGSARRATPPMMPSEIAGGDKGTVVGTFNAAAIAGMAGGGNALLESNLRQETIAEDIKEAILNIRGVAVA